MSEDKTISIVLDSPDRAQVVFNRLRALDYSDQWECVITPFKKKRSNEQNKLMRRHFKNLYAEGIGAGTPEEIHEDFKVRILAPYLRTVEIPTKKGTIYEWQQRMEEAKALHQKGLTQEANAIKALLYSLVSTTWLNVTQMSEYLDLIEQETAPMGFPLPQQPDQ